MTASGGPVDAVIRDLRESEREECVALWTTVWPGENSRAYFEKYFYGDVDWLPYYTQVAERNGRLVSAVQICKRVVSCGDFELTMGGVANVATLPEYRGCGYNTACLNRSVSIMEADAMDFSLLFTGIGQYYRRIGFTDLARTALMVRVPAGYDALEHLQGVRQALPADLPAIRAIYEHYNRARPITVRRTEAYWRDWIHIAERLPDLHVAEGAAGSIVGYILSGDFSSAVPYSSDSVDARVIEFGLAALPAEEQLSITHRLLAAIIAGMKRSASRMMRLEIPVTLTLQHVLMLVTGSAQVEPAPITGGMARILNRTALLQNVCLCRAERWRRAGAPQGSVSFDTPYGAASLHAGSTLRVIEGEPNGASPEQRLTHASLLSLIFGSGCAQASGMTRERRELLDAVFAPQEMVFWGSDGF